MARSIPSIRIMNIFLRTGCAFTESAEWGNYAAMNKRKSFEIEGLGHANPIPAISRIGNIVATGGVSGTDRETGKIPEGVGEQCAHMFANLRAILAEAGATP